MLKSRLPSREKERPPSRDEVICAGVDTNVLELTEALDAMLAAI
jgi:hypothetical protein